MSRKINFTKQNLEKLALPEKGKRQFYYDTKVRGLGVSITAQGTKTWIVYRKLDGHPVRITLGRYPDLSVDNARGMASHVNAQIAQGKNPHREKNKLRREITWGELFTHYLDKHAKLHKKSWMADQKYQRLYLNHWNARKLSHIKRHDVELLHASIGENHGLYAANRTIGLVSSMLNKAIDWGWDGSNPAIGVKKYREKSRDRFLSGRELPMFFKALAEEPNRTLADFLMIAILTGARRSNVLAMRWQDIDLDDKVWKIPETKNGSSHFVPLSPEAVLILRERLDHQHHVGWVFPSSRSRSGHFEEPKSGWKRILARAGIKDLRVHDLRRTLGSWQAATGANSYVIGKSLGHKTQQATAIYARLNLDPVRASIERATEAMMVYAR